ncbi:Serine/threonine-protein kinase ATG1a [Zea mays]|uniref:Serine/threonine-protein kinase ATG1a n=1 Tax=Zea mays TaxID=4577 RepID=A0A317YIM5_MAIZE|nr:Serine/threonine-protein kinase ATG1a [Zea mays]
MDDCRFVYRGFDRVELKDNLLLSTNGDDIVLKIGDFGFARSLVHENLAATICGSPYYMAPEIWQGKDYDAKSDLWSVGIILFQLVTGKLLFTGSNAFQLHQNVMATDDLNFPSEIEADLCPDCIDLCRRLLHRDPSGKFYESCHAVELRDNCQTITSPVVLKTKSGSIESKNPKVFDSWEWIEREYVLVPENCTSMEMSSLNIKSTKDDMDTRTASYGRSTGKGSVQNQIRDFTDTATGLSKGLYLEALSIELVLLTIWKEALDACSLLMDTSDGENFSKSCQEHFLAKSGHSPMNVVQGLDFTRTASIFSWLESGFMKAYDRAEKISHVLRKSDDNTEMPDAMDVTFQTAL